MAAKDSDQERKNEENIQVNFGMGEISFGGLFQGIGNLIDLVSRMGEEGQNEVQQEKEFTSPSGQVKAVYGLSVKTGLGGKPTFETFGNVRKSSKGPIIEQERQPLVDVFDEKDHIIIMAELPGVEEEQIKIQVEGDILSIFATNGERRYAKEVILPEGVDSDTVKSKYKNGILEIRMSKQ